MKCHGGPDGFPVAVYVSLLRFFLLDDVTFPFNGNLGLGRTMDPRVREDYDPLSSLLFKNNRIRKELAILQELGLGTKG